MINENNVALEVDVWDFLEEKLRTGIKDVVHLNFSYHSKMGSARVSISHPVNSGIKKSVIELDREKSDELVMKLCERFNISTSNISGLQFELRPCEVPSIWASFVPYVEDESTLNNTKSRMIPVTVD